MTLGPFRQCLQGVALLAMALCIGGAPSRAGHLGLGIQPGPKSSTIGVGQRVVTVAETSVWTEANPTAEIIDRYAVGHLGLVVGGPVEVDGTPWWRVNFEGFNSEGNWDGWVPVTALDMAYFPDPESGAGWRSLVPSGGTPEGDQKSAIRGRAGVDWDQLRQANDYSASFNGDNALLVIRNGYIVGEWGGRGEFAVASVSKSLTGLAVAKLFDLGSSGRLARSFEPGTPAHELLPESWTAGAPEKREIRLQHLMTMTSGLEPHDRPVMDNYYSVVLALPASSEPGNRWAYASAPVDLLAMAAETASGSNIAGVFNRYIAGPIGARSFSWTSFGNDIRASSGARTTARDLARVGHLMMMDGRWDDGSGQEALVPPGRINALQYLCGCGGSSFQPTEGSPFDVASEAPDQYGQLWWSNRNRSALGAGVPRDAFYAHGLRENLLVVVPSRSLVVVRLGEGPTSLPTFRRELMARVMDALVEPASSVRRGR